MEDRKPPYSIEAEEGLLCCIIIEEDNVIISGLCSSKFEPEFFYRERHQLIFAAMKSLYEKGESINEVTIQDQLEKEETLQEVGGIDYLIELSEKADTTLNAQSWAKIVREKYCLRKVIAELTKKIDDFYANPEDVKLELDQIGDFVASIQAEHSVKRQKTKEEVFVDVWKNFEDSVAGVEPEKVVYMPIKDFDEDFKIIKPHELIISGARTGHGKTSFALSVSRKTLVAGRKMDEIAKSPEAHVYFTVEMGPAELIERSAAQAAEVEADRLSKFSSEKIDRYKSWINFYKEVTEKQYFIRWTRSLPQMEAELRKIEGRHGKIKLIVVDYIQKVDFPGSHKLPMSEKYGHITGTLKAWTSSSSFGCPVIGCAQLGREVSKEAKEPELTDLRSSGDMEQDADRVWLFYKPKSINAFGMKINDQNDINEWNLDNPQKVKITQAKCRGGPFASRWLAFDRRSTNFKDWNG